MTQSDESAPARREDITSRGSTALRVAGRLLVMGWRGFVVAFGACLDVAKTVVYLVKRGNRAHNQEYNRTRPRGQTPPRRIGPMPKKPRLKYLGGNQRRKR